MKRLATLTAATAIAGAMALASAPASAAPFPVCPDQNESDWQSWGSGYTVDQQAWGNWLVAAILWDATPASMSGIYTIKEDFLFQVDPSTCGLAPFTCTSVYSADWFNHENADCSANVNGLGEYFDAGIINSNVLDGQYSLDLDLPNEEWAVFYDANRDHVNDGGSEHNILEGTVLCYANVNGNLYAVLEDDDGAYDGFASQNEGTPDLLNGTFHLGSGQYPSSLINAAFASGDHRLFSAAVKTLRHQGILTKSQEKALKECFKDDDDDDDD